MTILTKDAPNAIATRYCDFCGVNEYTAKFLIETPGHLHICDDCVATCVVLIEEAQKKSNVIEMPSEVIPVRSGQTQET